MYSFPIGAMLDSFRKPIPEAMTEIRRLGLAGMQLYAINDYDPDVITAAKTKELIRLAEDNELVFSAICGDWGQSFDDTANNPKNIERSVRTLEFAKEVGTDIVTTHIGTIPTDNTCDRYKIMQEACFKLAEYADSIHSHFAIETGNEPAEVLRGFLDTLHSRGVAVNFDPANLTEQDAHGAVKDVYTLKDYIVHTHAKDALNLSAHDEQTRRWYTENAFVQDGIYVEVPLGRGDVCFPDYLRALEDIGYRGFLTIERECGATPAEDIGLAAEYLRSVIKEG